MLKYIVMNIQKIKGSLKVNKIWAKNNRKNLLLGVVAAIIFIGGATFLWAATLDIPTLDSFDQRKVTESTKIYDRTGKVVLYDVFENVRRTVVPFNEISRYAKNATIAIEDREFYEHNGVKPRSFLRAVLVNTGNLEFTQGGSTITQQVVKNSLLTTDKKISRKLKEWVLALKLEKKLTKDEILSIYLNEIPYGGSIYGIEEASQNYFGVSANDLSLAQAAYLAALPQAPSFYSPFGNNRDKLETRKNVVLKEMFENNFISQEEYDAALKEKVEFLKPSASGIKAPHFVMFVKQYLEKKYGQEMVENGGLRVITTLDYELQSKGEEIVKEYALQNEKNSNAENAALVAIDPKTGDILTMIGSRDYFDKNIDGNFNVTTGLRQPGSAFKPFAYAKAFEKGYLPETVLFDLPTEFSTACSVDGRPLSPGARCYSPQNYNGKFKGPVSMRDALGQSINIVAVKTLYLAGLKDTIELARAMGVQSLKDPNQYGLTLVLGGGEVSLLDMTSAYSVFANGGVRNPYQAIIEIKDRDGNILEKQEYQQEVVLQKDTTLKISSILTDNVARTPLYGSRSALYFENADVAVKTGTTNDYRDAWIVGYTPSIAVGAWSGNNDNSPMSRKVSGDIVAPLWRAYMNEVFKKYPAERFEDYERENSIEIPPILRGVWRGGNTYLIDKISGKRATEHTPKESIEERVVGGVHSILYWVNKDNPRAGKPSNPENDPQFYHWELPVKDWAERQGLGEISDSTIPSDYDDVHKPENIPTAILKFRKNGNTFTVDEKVLVDISISSKYPIREVQYFLNGKFVGTTSQAPYSLSFVPEDQNLSGTQDNEIKAIVVDSIANQGTTSTYFKLSN